MSEPINLNRLAYFAAVVDARSFTRAAERLGVAKTVVSQQVARLEAQIGATLLVRTTRRVEPTEAGRMLHSRCIMILREAEDAFSELAESNTEPRGTLRITAPNDYGAAILAAVAAGFATRYPACRVELLLDDSRLDLIQSQIDLSIRVGWLDDSSLMARRIGTFRQLVVADPEIAAQFSSDDPDDLATIPFIANAALKEPLVWDFSRNDTERRSVRFRSVMSVNTTPAALAGVLAGGGASVLPDYAVRDEIRTGRLTHLLKDWHLPLGGVYVVYPAARYRPVKVSAFVAMLLERSRSMMGLEIDEKRTCL